MNYYNEIKQELINNEIYKNAKDYSKNRSDLKTYYNVGKILSEADRHYGEGIMKEYSSKLTQEFGKKYSTRLLYRILKFYTFIEARKVPTLSAKLSWSHYDELLKLDDCDKISYYIKIAEDLNLSVRQLRQKIKEHEYDRLPTITKDKMSNNDKTNIIDYIKNPIIIKNENNYEDISEKVLQQMILEDIPSFLSELGSGFTFIKNEYKIKMGNTYNYIDLLLFNYIYNCFVVVELKVTDLKKEHIGQVKVYMNYIDKNLKSDMHNKTIGIILVRRDNKYIIEYSSDDRITSREYLIV